MYFIHEISWFECFLHKTRTVFQKFNFSRFSIDWVCFSTDQKCLNFLSLVLPGSIDARLVLNQSNLFFDWSKPIFDQPKFLKFLKESYCLARLVPDRYSTDRISNEKNKRSLPSHVLQFFSKLFFLLLSSCASTNPKLKLFDFFFHQSSRVFVLKLW